eukprot:CAMPEP_0196582136 /NCGR_PEP_ID=MMETSP1081-20130531/37621_1 /TAXON_ID=36882 /ORGANISM="Pyramimonas amylifera, Strain CCMP720" /LENGTH=112 /DNA_ID=CAMNT_0041902619 /DNA_START=187 /DNA_END=525 /DNA_ORIENTATION=-
MSRQVAARARKSCTVVSLSDGEKLSVSSTVRSLQAGALSLAALAAHSPAASAATQIAELAHEAVDNGPAPFWFFIFLAVPAPVIMFITLSEKWGSYGQNFKDGTNSPEVLPK